MATYQIDNAHSDVNFKVKHLAISNVSGSFSRFSGTVTADAPDFSDALVNFTIDVDSILTGNEQRDQHLKSADFFETEKYPQLTFVSRKLADGKLTGDLTIRGVTREVELDVEYNGTVTDPYGQTKAGFEVNGKINRQEFGLTWSALTEAGGLLVGNDIKLQANIQLVKQA
jgi:polyisoprenoid-binding protein YceI